MSWVSRVLCAAPPLLELPPISEFSQLHTLPGPFPGDMPSFSRHYFFRVTSIKLTCWFMKRIDMAVHLGLELKLETHELNE
jgi:hypothetical protein